MVDTPTFLDLLVTVSIYLTLGLFMECSPHGRYTYLFRSTVNCEYLSYTRSIHGMLSLVDTPTFLDLLATVSIYLTLGLFMKCSSW